MKILFLIIILAVSLFLGYIFYIGFALIVRPPYGNSEAETLKNMANFCIESALKNFFLSLVIGIVVLFIGQRFIFKKLKVSFLVFIAFVSLSNIGNFIGVQNYFYGLQDEFKYHQFKE